MFRNMQLPNRSVIKVALLPQMAFRNFLFSKNGHLLETVQIFMPMLIYKEKYINTSLNSSR